MRIASSVAAMSWSRRGDLRDEPREVADVGDHGEHGVRRGGDVLGVLVFHPGSSPQQDAAARLTPITPARMPG